jgi:putative transposase
MPRRPRIIVPGTPLHIIQRGNNRQACFFTDEDYLFYLDWLKKYTRISRCSVHAFVLMKNHVHLLLTPQKAESAGKLMKRLGQRYVQYVNRTYQRSGTLWEGRFRSCIIQQETYLFTCQRYIEMNPVRAGRVQHPGEYRWSSFGINAQGEPSGLIKPHSLYKKSGRTVAERQQAYRELFQQELDPVEIDKIRKATNGNFSLGDDQFNNEISELLGRRVSPGKAGRPKKRDDCECPQFPGDQSTGG